MSDLDKLTPAELASALAVVRVELLAAALSLLPVELLLAARLGVEVGDLRAGRVLDQDYDQASPWHRQHVLPRYSELQRRRYPPTGDRELWIKYGPDGPPWLAEREAA